MDLKYLQLRSYADPKKFMKTKKMEIPKHFEVTKKENKKKRKIKNNKIKKIVF